MRRMDLSEDEALRQQGWRVFRSSTRDRLIPATGQGAALRRIQIAQALPVPGVFEGVAVSMEVREARAVASKAVSARLPDGEDIPQGIMQYFDAVLVNQVVGAVNNIPTDEPFTIGVVPYDGWLREFWGDASGGDPTGARVAVRVSNGGTLFRGFRQPGLAAGFNQLVDPDFVAFDGRGAGNFRVELRAGKVPVYAGDQIQVVLRNTNGVGALLMRIAVVIGVETVVLGSLGVRVSRSTSSVLTQQAILANREAAKQAGALAIEQERTRRVEVAAQAEAALLAQRLAGATIVRASVPAPAPRAARPPATPPEGAGQTFVSAWNPSFGNIGYLIPDPPRGGKVNVFDNKYSVFDITGKLIDQGAIIPVGTDQDIPPGARISPVRGGVKSPGMRLDTLQVLT